MAEHYARARGLTKLEWLVRATACTRPNPRLRPVLERMGFEVKSLPDRGQCYWRLVRLRVEEPSPRAPPPPRPTPGPGPGAYRLPRPGPRPPRFAPLRLSGRGHRRRRREWEPTRPVATIASERESSSPQRAAARVSRGAEP